MSVIVELKQDDNYRPMTKPMNKMKPGDIAVVVSPKRHAGVIIQCVARDSNRTYQFFGSKGWFNNEPDFTVRDLVEGEYIEIRKG